MTARASCFVSSTLRANPHRGRGARKPEAQARARRKPNLIAMAADGASASLACASGFPRPAFWWRSARSVSEVGADALLGQGAIEDVRFEVVTGLLAAVEVHGKDQVALAGKAPRVRLHPLVQGKITVQQEQSREWPC